MTGVVEEDVAGVGSCDDEVGVEGGEFCGEDVGSGVEGEFGGGVGMEVPDVYDAVGVVGCGGVFGVRGEEEFGEL